MSCKPKLCYTILHQLLQNNTVGFKKLQKKKKQSLNYIEYWLKRKLFSFAFIVRYKLRDNFIYLIQEQ